MSHIFYDTKHLTIEEKKELLTECKELSYKWWADTLDCKISPRRQRYECTFEEILDMLTLQCHYVVIDRGDWGLVDKPYFEIGFSTMGVGITYFLFINVEKEKMPPIIEKYELTRLN